MLNLNHNARVPSHFLKLKILTVYGLDVLETVM